MIRTRSLIRVALIAAAAATLLGGFGLAAPAAAHVSVAAGVIGPGSGRAGASLAAAVALIGRSSVDWLVPAPAARASAFSGGA